MPEGPPSPVDVIRLEPMGRFKQTQNGNVRVQGGFLIFRFFFKKKQFRPPQPPHQLSKFSYYLLHKLMYYYNIKLTQLLNFL